MLFRAEAKPAIAKRRAWLAGALSLSLCLLLAPTSPALADEHIASVREMEGSAFAYLPGTPTRRLGPGDRIVENTKIVTAKNASLTLVFTDDTEFALGGGTIVNIDEYRYRAKTSANDEPDVSFTASILGGVVRTVTGLVAKYRPRSVTFRTTVATIGVRGTHFTAEVQGSSATIILLAQAAADQSNAIEVSNQFGKVEIEEPGYGTEIPDANSPPSPPRRMDATNNMNRILRSVNTTRRVRIPRSPMR